jgi:hypothetical protein
MAYAENTEIAVEKSMSEIVGMIRNAGAERIAQVEEPGTVAIQFFLRERMLRFRVALPAWDTMPKWNGRRELLTDDKRKQMAAQRAKQRARALMLVIKAKIESVESGVETFDEAFMPNVVMPDGKTVAQHTLSRIAEGYADGRMPALMLPSY